MSVQFILIDLIFDGAGSGDSGISGGCDGGFGAVTASTMFALQHLRVSIIINIISPHSRKIKVFILRHRQN